MISPGQTIGHYEILSALGRGGMGEVYLAQDRTLHRKVALKFVSAPFTADQSRLRRFEQEARAASALNHPNILTIHEIGEADGHHFIASEFIDGETLRQRILLARALAISGDADGSQQAYRAFLALWRDADPDLPVLIDARKALER